MVNRTQAFVLGFYTCFWIAAVTIVILAPEVYAQNLGLPPDQSRPLAFAFLGGLTAFLVVLAVGVVRRWRWTFWLLLVASLAGVLRAAISALELTGVLPRTGPGWYVVTEGLIGLLQLGIGLAMLAAYRRNGVWGSF